jgi:membrane-bound serine protease (ClpP class)
MWHASKPAASPPRWLALAFLIWGALLLPLHAAPAAQNSDASRVIVLTFAGPVTPILETYLTDSIRQAEQTGAAAVILQLDTPGGSVEVTQSIIQVMLASPVPLVVYVAPAGARAGSAGTFITLAAHVAAMSPNTSIGAASPVDASGTEIDPTLAAKITNILSADIENLAQRRGEAATDWAIAAVQDAAAATADQARELGVIDIIAADLPDLLRQLDGRTVTLPNGSRTLQTARAAALPLEMTPLQRALNFLVDPNLATILLSLGVLGLVVEIRSPGFGAAGILGLIALLLALYGLGQLDANLTGLAFMAVALALFIAEAFTPTFGLLTLGGIAAFIFGGALLFDTPGIATPWATLIALAIILGALTLLVGYLALSIQRRPALTGSEALIGSLGHVAGAIQAGQTGSVFAQGEWWRARLTRGRAPADSQVRVMGREGFTLLIEPIPPLIVPPSNSNADSDADSNADSPTTGTQPHA